MPLGEVQIDRICAAGALFGNIPIVRNNFSKVILLIIVVSVLPIAWEAFGAWRAARREKARATQPGTASSGKAKQ